MALDQLQHVGARWGTPIANADDLANFGHTQPDRLRSPNEGETGQGIALILAVPRHRSRRLGQQAGFLVIAQRRRRQAAAAGQLANSHRASFNYLTLEHSPMFRLWPMPDLNT